MNDLPLVDAFDDSQPICWSRKREYSVAEYCYAITKLAEELPGHRYVINDCRNRFGFLVSLGACILREQISLFPSNNTPHTRKVLKKEFESIYCIADQESIGDMECVDYQIAESLGKFESSAVPRVPADRVVAIAFTSGTTGMPRRYERYWGRFVNESKAGANSLGLNSRGINRVVCTVPPQHMYGFITSVMLALHGNCATYAGQPLYPEDTRLALESSTGSTVLVTTPVQLRACVSEGIKSKNLGLVLSSAAPLDRNLAQKAETGMEVPVMEFYGSTESGAIALRHTTEEEEWETFEGHTVSKEQGLFTIRAPYYPGPIKLTDRVDILSQSRFLFLGRDSDLIKIGGKRASLIELNAQLLDIEGVLDGIFLLVHGQNGKESRLTAFVVAPTLTQAEIIFSLRARIDEVFLPRPVRLVSALPRTAAGKLPQQKLDAMLENTL